MLWQNKEAIKNSFPFCRLYSSINAKYYINYQGDASFKPKNQVNRHHRVRWERLGKFDRFVFKSVCWLTWSIFQLLFFLFLYLYFDLLRQLDNILLDDVWKQNVDLHSLENKRQSVVLGHCVCYTDTQTHIPSWTHCEHLKNRKIDIYN